MLLTNKYKMTEIELPKNELHNYIGIENENEIENDARSDDGVQALEKNVEHLEITDVLKLIEALNCKARTLYIQDNICRYILLRTNESNSILLTIDSIFSVKITDADSSKLYYLESNIKISHISLLDLKQIFLCNAWQQNKRYKLNPIKELNEYKIGDNLRLFNDYRNKFDISANNDEVLAAQTFQTIKQFQRYRESVSTLHYKIAMLNDSSLVVITSENDIQVYSIEGKQNSSMYENRLLCFTVSLQDMFSERDSLHVHLSRLQEKFVSMLDNLQRKQEVLIDEQTNSLLQINKVIDKIHGSKVKFEQLFDNLRNFLNQLQARDDKLQKEFNTMNLAVLNDTNERKNELREKIAQNHQQINEVNRKITHLKQNYYMFAVEVDDIYTSTLDHLDQAFVKIHSLRLE